MELYFGSNIYLICYTNCVRNMFQSDKHFAIYAHDARRNVRTYSRKVSQIGARF